VQYSFEALGSKTTAEQSFAMLKPGGLATIIGMVPFGTKIELHGADFLRDRARKAPLGVRSSETGAMARDARRSCAICRRPMG